MKLSKQQPPYNQPTFVGQNISNAHRVDGHGVPLQSLKSPFVSQETLVCSPSKEEFTIATKEIGGSITTKGTESFDTPLPPRPQGPGWRFHAAFGCLCLVNLVCALDATSLAVAIPVRILILITR
jgi:hypothetical protein